MDNFTLTLIFLGIGVVLLIVEMFTPGLGVAGALGIIALFVAVLLQIGNPIGILFMIALVLFLVAVALLIFFRLAMRGRFDKSHIVLKEQINGESTDVSDGSTRKYIGSVGMALTPLRPAGKAVFGKVTLDVATAGEFLPSGARVEVTQAEGLRILVRAAAEEMPSVDGGAPDATL